MANGSRKEVTRFGAFETQDDFVGKFGYVEKFIGQSTQGQERQLGFLDCFHVGEEKPRFNETAPTQIVG